MVGITKKSLELWRSYLLTCPACGYSRACMQREAECKKCGAEITDFPARFPEFYSAWKAAEDAAENAGDDLFAIKTRQWALEQMVSLYNKSKTQTDKRQAIKMILELTADVADNGTAVDYSEMTDEELVSAALARNLSVEASVLASVKGV